MFNELIESKPKKQRSTGGTIFSVVMHAVLGGLLIYATANAGQELTKEKGEEVKFVEVPKDFFPDKRIKGCGRRAIKVDGHCLCTAGLYYDALVSGLFRPEVFK